MVEVTAVVMGAAVVVVVIKITTRTKDGIKVDGVPIIILATVTVMAEDLFETITITTEVKDPMADGQILTVNLEHCRIDSLISFL